jgi:hypothetical protein
MPITRRRRQTGKAENAIRCTGWRFHFCTESTGGRPRSSCRRRRVALRWAWISDGGMRSCRPACRRLRPVRRFLPACLPASWRVGAPLGEIHLPAAFVDVVGDDPRGRRHAGIPGSASLIGVAVVAGAVEDAAHSGRHRPDRVNRLCRIDGGVAPVHRHQLQGDEQDDDCDSDLFPSKAHPGVQVFFLRPPGLSTVQSETLFRARGYGCSDFR